LYKYKTEPTTALKSHGKMYQQLRALLKLACMGKDGVPGNSSPCTRVLRRMCRRMTLQEFDDFSGISRYCLSLHCSSSHLSNTDNVWPRFLCLSA
jgi:hypothetical protein